MDGPISTEETGQTSAAAPAPPAPVKGPKIVWVMLKETMGAYVEDSCLSRGAAIAYFTIFSLAPVLVVMIAIAGFVFGEDAARGLIFTKLKGMMGSDAAGLIQSMIQSASNTRSGIIATATSLILLIVSASGVFGELQSSLNIIWKTDGSAHSTVSRLVQARARSLGLVASLGFLMLVTLAISTAITAAWNRLNAVVPVPGAGIILSLLNLTISFAITAVLFGAVYKVLPDKRLEWRDVIVGSIFTAILYMIGKTAISLYIGSSHVASSYGAASALVVLLLWIYYSAQIFLLGAEFTKVYAHRFGSHARPHWDFWRHSGTHPARRS